MGRCEGPDVHNAEFREGTSSNEDQKELKFVALENVDGIQPASSQDCEDCSSRDRGIVLLVARSETGKWGRAPFTGSELAKENLKLYSWDW